MTHKHNEKTDLKKQLFKKKPVSDTSDMNALGFWKGVGAQLNDNPHYMKAQAERFRYVFSLAVFVAGLVSFFMLNSAYIFTQTMLRVDDGVLATAMEINPDAVAYALNNMNIGE